MVGGGDWHQSKARKENETQRQRTERNAKQRAGGASAKSLFFPDLNVLSTHCAIVAINDSRSLFIFNLAGSYVPKRTLTCTSAEMQHQHSLDFQLRGAERKIAPVALSRGGPVGRAPPQTCGSEVEFWSTRSHAERGLLPVPVFYERYTAPAGSDPRWSWSGRRPRTASPPWRGATERVSMLGGA